MTDEREDEMPVDAGEMPNEDLSDDQVVPDEEQRMRLSERLEGVIDSLESLRHELAVALTQGALDIIVPLEGKLVEFQAKLEEKEEELEEYKRENE